VNHRPRELKQDESLEPYAEIVALAERELALAGNGEIDGLSSLAGEWERLTRGLPDSPPPAAAPLIEQAAFLNKRARIELNRLRETLLGDLTKVTHASRAGQGYAPSSRRRRWHLDRSV
jgi:hypothetical protein